MTHNQTQATGDIETVLGIAVEPKRGRRGARIFSTAALVAAIAAGGYMLADRDAGPRIQYLTEALRRGDITVTVTATGNLEPVNQVDVGTEVSGTIDSVEVDNNDRVRAGQVLARLDTDRLEAQVRQSRATLAASKARLLEARASVLETGNEARRIRELRKKNMVSDMEVDTAEAKLKRAEAAEASALAQIEEATAQLSVNETFLSKAVIVSPIDGLVLDRSVEPGQTVAASLQTPVLFSLAENLTQMELHVAVDEADVGSVNEGQTATFSVDAYPDREFPARITKVRWAAQTTEGVVSYETLLAVDNSDLALRPGMTATAEITVRSLSDVLLVPNAALRFSGPPARSGRSGERSLVGALLPHPPRGATNEPKEGNSNGRDKFIWLMRDGVPVRVPVRTGASDGSSTEILSGDVAPGNQVIVDTVSSSR